MIKPEDYQNYVEKSFEFLIKEFQFRTFKKTFNGNFFYDIEYKNKKMIISISLENIENYFQVILTMLNNGKIKKDGTSKSFNLNKINNLTLTQTTKLNFETNNRYFENIEAVNEIQRKIFKSAKDLRLFLKNINQIEIIERQQ